METIVKQPRLLEHLLPLAIRSHGGTSFSPEKRGETVVNDYSNELSEDLKQILEAADKYGTDNEFIEAACSRYSQKYEQYLSAYLSSHSNIVSTMIAGPSNFPVRQMEKRNRWADNKYSEFREYRTRAMKAILKNFKPIIDPLEKAKKDLEQREKTQIAFREINKALRKHKNNPDEQVKAIMKSGMSEATARKLLIPDYAGRIGIPAYSLTNNNANIKRLKSRVSELEQKNVNAETIGEQSIMNGDVEIVFNHTIDRLQILFPCKPEAGMISKLKSKGFRWSPSNKAWQRQLTRNAQDAAEEIISAKK